MMVSLLTHVCVTRPQWGKLLTLHVPVAWWCHQMEIFPRYCPFVCGIHRSPVNSPHKRQWRRALMFSMICVLNQRLSKQLCVWWFETPTLSLWRYCNGQSRIRPQLPQRPIQTMYVSFCSADWVRNGIHFASGIVASSNNTLSLVGHDLSIAAFMKCVNYQRNVIKCET